MAMAALIGLSIARLHLCRTADRRSRDVPRRGRALPAACSASTGPRPRQPSGPPGGGRGNYTLSLPLEKYRAKRSAETTPEPFGRAGGPAAALRRPEARGAGAPLRLSARVGRGAEVVGRPQGALPRPRGQAPRRAGRGPPGRVRGLRGDHPRGELRGGPRHRLGPRPLAPIDDPDAGASTGSSSSSSRATSCAASGPWSAPAQGHTGEGMAPHQEARTRPRPRRRDAPRRSRSSPG